MRARTIKVRTSFRHLSCSIGLVLGLFLLLTACSIKKEGANDQEITRFSEIYGEYLVTISSDTARTQQHQSYLQTILDRHGMSHEQFVRLKTDIELDGVALKKMLEIVNAKLETRMAKMDAPPSPITNTPPPRIHPADAGQSRRIP